MNKVIKNTDKLKKKRGVPFRTIPHMLQSSQVHEFRLEQLPLFTKKDITSHNPYQEHTPPLRRSTHPIN